MSEEPGGMEIASAYVSVSPNTDTFAEQLEGELGELNYVVNVPVVPDAGDFAAEVDTAVAESKAEVAVPVVPDTEGFQVLIDQAAADAKAEVTVPVVPDAASLPEEIQAQADAAKAEVTVPLVPDVAGFAEAAEADTSAAGESAGSAFSSRFLSVIEGTVPEAIPGMIEGALPAMETAGEAAGTAYGSAFNAAERAFLASYTATFGEGEAAAATAGTEAGAAYSARYLSVIEGTIPERIPGMIEGTLPAIEQDGEAAGAGFLSRFSGALSGLKGALTGLIPGMTSEAEDGGAAAGEGFGARFKSAVMGDISPLEALMGAAFVGLAADMATKFQAAMELIHTQAGVAQSAISGLSGSVLNLAGQVGENPDSLAQALYHVESSFQSVGISGQKAMQLVQVAAEGARTGNANLVDVTNALDATIVAGVPGVNSYAQAMGALNAIVGSGDMTMQNLADALGSGIMAVAKSYGQTIYQVGAALATLGDDNIRGAKAATDLRMAWQALQAPLTTAGPILDSLGLSMTQLGQTMEQHGMTAAIQEFVDRLEASKIPVAEWGQYVTEIFGKRAGVGIGIFIDQLDRLKGKIPDIEQGAADFGNAWSATEATTSQKLHDLEAGFDALMIRIGDGLLPAVNAFMGMISRNLPAIEHFGTEIAHLVAPVVTDFFTGLEAILKLLFGPLKDVTLAVIGLTAAQLALNVVMDMNPFVAIGVALITLTGLIIKYHTQIIAFIEKTWNDILSFLKGLWQDVVNFAKSAWLASLLGLVVQYHNDIVTFIEQVWNKIYSFLAQIIGKIISFFTSSWDAIKAGVVTAFDDIKDTILGIWDDILSGIETIVGKIKSVISSITGGVSHAVGSVLSAVGLAGGGVVPGYAPGRDSVHAMLSPGEAVLVPEAVRAIGPARIHAINAHYSRHRGGSMAYGGIIPGYAGGGVITPNPVPQQLAAGILQVLQQFAGQSARPGTLGGYDGPVGGVPQPYNYGGQGQSAGAPNIYITFNGAKPTSEEMQAISMRLSAAVGMS